jgi:hypothetical protein
MAKRRQEEEQESILSWYDKPLYDTGDDSDPFADADDVLPAKERRGAPAVKLPREVGFVGGCFNVFLIAILSILIFVALGIGIVLGGRALGILPNVASADTEPAAVVQIATPAAIATEESCEPQSWWEAQRGAFDYFTTLYDRVTIAPPNETPDEIDAQMSTQREAAAAQSSCLAAAQEPFTQGMNDAIGAVETYAASGKRRASEQAESASAALSATLVALWDLGIATDPNTPPILDIPRGGGCDATQLTAWSDRFRQQWQQVDVILSQTDVAAANADVVQQAVTGLEAVRSNLSAIPAPQCVSRVNQLSVIGLNSYINGANATLQGNPDAARESASTYARSRVALNAWLSWLGVEMV